MRLVDDDTVLAGNRSSVHGARSSLQRRDRSGHVVLASQPSSAGVAGSDAVVRLEHNRPGGFDRKCENTVNCPLINDNRICDQFVGSVTATTRTVRVVQNPVNI